MTERLLRLEEDLLKAQSEVSKTTMETLETSPRSPPPEFVAELPAPISRAPSEQNKTHGVSSPAGTNTGGAANAAVRETAHYKSLLARFTYLRVLHDFIASDLGHYLNLQASINDGALEAIRFQNLWDMFQLRDCLDQFHTGSQRTQSSVLAPGPRLSSTVTTWAAIVILLAQWIVGRSSSASAGRQKFRIYRYTPFGFMSPGTKSWRSLRPKAEGLSLFAAI